MNQAGLELRELLASASLVLELEAAPPPKGDLFKGNLNTMLSIH